MLQNSKPRTTKDWSRRIAGEPPIAQVLSDPIVVLLMQRDQVSYHQLQHVMAEVRQHLTQLQTAAA